MGSKKSGILEKIKEGDQIGREAIESGEQLEGDGSEIKSLLDGIDMFIKTSLKYLRN